MTKERVLSEWRVLSKREGCAVKVKRYRVKRAADDRVGRLMSPEPWRFYGSESNRRRDGDELACCAGTVYHECACGGYTVRQQAEAERSALPRLEWVRVEVRAVTEQPWTHLPDSPSVEKEHA